MCTQLGIKAGSLRSIVGWVGGGKQLVACMSCQPHRALHLLKDLSQANTRFVNVLSYLGLDAVRRHGHVTRGGRAVLERQLCAGMQRHRVQSSRNASCVRECNGTEYTHLGTSDVCGNATTSKSRSTLLLRAAVDYRRCPTNYPHWGTTRQFQASAYVPRKRISHGSPSPVRPLAAPEAY